MRSIFTRRYERLWVSNGRESSFFLGSRWTQTWSYAAPKNYVAGLIQRHKVLTRSTGCRQQASGKVISRKNEKLWLLAAFGDSLKRRIMCSGARQAREDTCCPHGTASPACTTLARTVLRRLAAPPRMPRYPCGRPHLTAMPVATDMTTPRWRAPVTGHVGLPPGPASRGEPARSGGARDQDAPGQTCGASPS